MKPTYTVTSERTATVGRYREGEFVFPSIVLKSNRRCGVIARLAALAIAALVLACTSVLFAQSLGSGNASAGYEHTLLLKADGTLWGFGKNDAGQLGNGTTTTTLIPVQVTGLNNVAAVRTGFEHTAAVKSNGTVWAFGKNDFGQLGDGTNQSSSVPVQVTGITNAVAVAVGVDHTVVLKGNGTVWAFGGNAVGQLGDGSTNASMVPVQVSGLSGVVAVAAGNYFTVALKADGTVWAFGDNSVGQLGDGSGTGQTFPVQVTTLTNIQFIAAAGAHALMVKNDGTVWACGSNYSGQLGDGTNVSKLTPVQMIGATDVIAASCGISHSMLLKSDGSVLSCGNNQFGQLGDGTLTSHNVVVPAVAVTGAVAVSAGAGHSVAVQSNGTVWAVGDNRNGQLSDGIARFHMTPIEATGLVAIKKVATGGSHTLVLHEGGTVSSFGRNSEGQLGDGTAVSRENSVQLAGLTDIKAIAAGNFHSVAVKSDGTVWTCGWNQFGQLGDGSSTNRVIPVQISGLTDVVEVAAGFYHTVALKDDGTVWTVGYNGNGQLGDGTTTGRLSPVQVLGLSGIVAVAAGDFHTLALKDDGTVWSFGSNLQGQLGAVGIGDYSASPVQVAGMGDSPAITNVVGIAGGEYHAVVLKADGTVWGFGSGSYGALGDGSYGGTSSLIQVNGLYDIVSVECGSGYTLALKNDGTLWELGNQEGGSQMVFQPTPTQVAGLKGIKSVSAGYAHTVALKDDGTVVTLRLCESGQLGEGLSQQKTEPRLISGINLLNEPDSVVITSPLTNTVVPLGGSVTLSASATGGEGSPDTITWYHHGTPLGIDPSVPYTFDFTPTTWGKFELTAVGVDSNGAYSARSAPVVIDVPYDSDSNGLPDWWEMKHFAKLGNPPAGDPDFDGATNLQEYTAGTNPLDPVAIAGASGSPDVIPWTGNASGSNSGAAGGVPSPPSAISTGTTVDESLFDWVTPNQGSAAGEGMKLEGFWGYLNHTDRTFYWNSNNGVGQPLQIWSLWQSPNSFNSSTTFALTFGSGMGWDQGGGFWSSNYYYGVTPSARSSRGYGDYEEPLYDPSTGDEGYVDWHDSWTTTEISVRASLEEAAERWYYYYYNKVKIIQQDGVEVSREVLEPVRLVIPLGELVSGQVNLAPRAGDTLDHGKSEEIRLEAVETTGQAQPGFSISASDAAGPSYRKVGLNGLPLSDSKPQNKDESGEISEETFIDAYTRQLNHSVSDVYSAVDSSLIPLAVRRSARERVWTLRSGLRPSEEPDAPFGPGWSSNLCANIRFEDNYRKATVTDEQGASTVFFRVLRDEEGELLEEHIWIHSRQEKQDARTAFDTLETLKDEEGVVVGFKFRKKYGTVCNYAMTTILQLFTNDRTDGSHTYTDYSYARLTSVEDRWGNELQYTYPSDTTLIPRKIHDPSRPNQVVTITQNDGVVTAVRGPSGELIEYNYATKNTGDDTVRCLSSVERGGNTTSYQYETEIENTPPADLDADGPPDSDHRHFGLTRITDERGGHYDFDYEFNHGNKYVEVSGHGFRNRSQLGMPRLVTQVELPNHATVSFSGSRTIQTNADGTLAAVSVQTQVSGSCGTYTYTFSQPDVFIPLATDPGREHDPFSKQLTVFFSRMTIDTPAGDEVFNFDFDHGMALTSAKDISGNTTTFHYGSVGSNGLGWDDPIRQANAKGDSRYFTYDDDTRVMKSVTDERGTLTSYVVNSTTGLRTKETISKSGVVLQETDFDYGAGGFTGFLASTTVQSTSATNGDMVTAYTPDANGRVQKQTVQAGFGIELVTSYTYTGNGSKKTVTNPRGHTTTFTYDAQSLRLEKVENPDGSERTLDYDAHGNLVEEVNELDVTTTHTYDALNRRTSSTVDMGIGPNLVSSTTYNAFNLPVTQTDPRGTITTYTYDNIGRRLTSTVGSGPAALTTTFTYGTNSGGSVFDVSGFKPTTVKDPRDNLTTNTYDDLYRLTVQDGPEGHKITTTYDDVGNPVEVKDALNRITTTTFDGLNRPTKVEYPGGATRWSYYTPAGQVWKVKDELGRETLTQYDRAGRAIEVTQPAVNGVSPVIKTAYDTCGNVIAVQDALGNIATTVYDNRNRPTKVISPYVWDAIAGEWARPEVSTTYDDGGNVLTVTDALGAVTTNVYDNANRVIRVTDALSQVTEQDYDANGNVVETRDALNREVHNTYDAYNRLVETEDAEEQVTEFAYDKNGNRTSVTDPRGKVTTFTYDGLNRLKKEIFQEGVWVEHFYDAIRETSREDNAGREFAFGYDSRDRLTGTTWTVGGSPVTRTRVYDLAGNLTSVTETGRPEATVSYTYDDLNRVATETSQGLTHTYTYDLAGHRTQTDLGTDRTLTSTFDSQGKPLTVSEDGRTTTYHYDLAGRAVAQAQPNGAWQYNGYDVLGRLQYRQMFDGTSALLAQILWTHDAVGNVTSQSERWPGDATRGSNWRSTAMVYDDTNRLVGEAVVTTGGAATATGYAYDEGSNRTLKQVSTNGNLTTSTGYTYSNFNQLTAWSEENGLAVTTRAASFTYDDAGNRATQSLTVTGQPAEVTTYHWDAENRLEGVTLPNADEHEYNYDYRMRRISRLENGLGSAIVFSGGTSVAEYENGGLTPTVEYLRGPDMGGGVGGMLYSLRNGGNDAKYTLSNGRGDVVGQSDGTGDLTWTASYEAYGKRTVETGTNLDRQRANTKEEDPTGLLNEGFRYRDLETGVWLSRDPAGFVDGPNLYAYVRQNPWTSFDPEGLWVEDAVIGIPSLCMGAKSFWDNAWAGNGWSATLDAVGVVVDGAAIAVPGVPGGAGIGIKASRMALKAADKVNDGVDAYEKAQTVVEVAQAAASGDSSKLVEVVVEVGKDKLTGKKKGKGDGSSPTTSQKNTQQDNDEVVYHGTTTTETVTTKGLSTEERDKHSPENEKRGFSTTTSRETAEEWARYKASQDRVKGEPVILQAKKSDLPPERDRKNEWKDANEYRIDSEDYDKVKAGVFKREKL